MPELEPDQQLWERVNACLDARSDPFADRELALALVRAPRVAREVRGLLASLARIAPASAPRPAFARPRQGLGLLAAALALAALGSLWFARQRTLSAAEPLAVTPRATGISLAVLRPALPPARGARVVRTPRRVLAWKLEGNQP